MITDTIVYIYNKKNKELTKHKIKSDIIKENKIYNINKSIKALNTIIDNNIKTKLFKTKIIFLLSKNISPAEKYCFDKVFNNIQNINYSTVNIESLIEDNKEIIIFDDLIYTKTKSINVTNDNELKEMFKGKLLKNICFFARL